MFGKLIVGYDGSEQSRDALALARVLAAPSGQVIAACVYSYEPVYSKGGGDDFTYGEALRAEAESVVATAKGATGRRAVPGSSPAHAIHGLAEVEKADLIVVGSTHHGAIGKVLIGSVGEKLLHGSPCPVAVAPKGLASSAPGVEIRKVAVAYDGAQESERALQLAARVAGERGGKLQLYTAVEPPTANNALFPSDDGWPRHAEAGFIRAQERLEAAIAELPQELGARGDLIFGTAAEALANDTRGAADLLVMGSRGYGLLHGVILGRVSAELARSAPCPLLVVPRGAELPVEEEPMPEGALTSLSAS